MQKYLYLFFILSSTQIAFSQDEANIWYWGIHCGLDFNSGTPIALYDGQTTYPNYSTATISDSIGNLLFYTDWNCVITKNGIMPNSSGIVFPGSSGRAIIKWPKHQNLYYILTSTVPPAPEGLYYSIVDLNENNGWGAITEKNVLVIATTDVDDRIAVVQQENSENVWVIVRKYVNDAFAAFLVDENGLDLNPVISAMPDRDVDYANFKFIRISSDKKYIASYHSENKVIDFCRFNSSTGSIEYMYTYDGMNNILGMEFSPDSKYLYISCGLPDYSNEIYQLDMQYIADKYLFNSSAIKIGTGSAVGMQLARDGKIYCSASMEWSDDHYIGVIHNPWIRGEGCLYELHTVNLYPGEPGCVFSNILVDYLLRFEWEGEQCQSYPIQFKPNFIPTPDSITWYFDEFAPGSLTHELYPVYAFQNAGIHEITVDVWYPNGRYEHTSREIEIYPTPVPDLGPDLLICEGSSDTLNANCVADFYSWNGLHGGPQYVVSDSGTYRVMATIVGTNCHGTDTIHVGFYPPTVIDETNMVITPTTCNGVTGSITGLAALGSQPFAYQWLDLSGNDYGTNIDATGLPAGQYQLTITDGNGCVAISEVYTIEDAGNLQVLTVDLIQPHCGRPDGQIIVHGFNPSGSALQYSIDDGATYQADSVFSGLVGTGYVVRVTDGFGCFGFYVDNPVVLEDIPGPQVMQVNVTDETDFQGNGAIEIIASSPASVIYYSIDSGATWQENDGNYENLVCNMYYVIIRDGNECDTAFSIEVQNIIKTYLHAVTGEGGHCLGNAALVPVNVDNFIGVADFRLKLSYNADNLQCEGFANVQPQLASSLTGWVDQLAGDIYLAWDSSSSVTFTEQEKVADLVFTTKNQGQGELSWYTGLTESYFKNSSGNPIAAQFSTGQVTVYDPPVIRMEQSKTACEGQLVMVTGTADGNQKPIDYTWIYPDGDTSDSDLFFFNITSSDGGIYTLLATDRVGCTDQQSIELIVSENPVAAFHGSDTLEMHAGDVLDAGEGMASYKWSTGDTTSSLVVDNEGDYNLEMTSQTGCTGSDSVYVKLISGEIPGLHIYIPNAFSPNGDGLNDIFQIIFPNSTFKIQNLTLCIFNRWGEEIFHSDDISGDWDGTIHGKDCPGGVYVYKIVFSLDGVPGSQERVGTVMLVR